LAKNSPDRRRLLTLGIILAVAFCGLLLIISRQDVAADRTGGPGITQAVVEKPAAAETATFESAYGSIFKMLAALVVVIGCIYGGLYLLGRLMGRRGKGAAGGRNLELLESTYVGPKKSVSLLRVGERSVLVGVTESGISMLTELSEQETASLLAAQEAPAEETFGMFLKSAYSKVARIRMKQNEVVT
jgi:flagellar protein FliO/FliZ